MKDFDLFGRELETDGTHKQAGLACASPSAKLGQIQCATQPAGRPAGWVALEPVVAAACGRLQQTAAAKAGDSISDGVTRPVSGGRPCGFAMATESLDSQRGWGQSTRQGIGVTRNRLQY